MMRIPRLFYVLLLVALPGALSCSSPGAAPELPPASNSQGEGFLPTPYSAEEIRAHCEPGRTMVFRLESVGEPIGHQVFHFTHDQDGASVFEAWQENGGREPVSEVYSDTPDWTELQGHASFVAARTTVEPAEATTPLGTLPCWLYTVRDEAKDEVQRFWFATERPGPPVLVEREVGGEIRSRMTMIEDRAE